ncbi:MAG: CPBP family intramembrane metalloprotease [Treponema sp.]|nr:CPBP family intramembrane metalloprotease [Treponema sp.]
MAGFAEESLFRFLIYSKILNKYLNKFLSIIIISLLFALCHGQLKETRLAERSDKLHNADIRRNLIG